MRRDSVKLNVLLHACDVPNIVDTVTLDYLLALGYVTKTTSYIIRYITARKKKCNERNENKQKEKQIVYVSVVQQHYRGHEEDRT